MQMENRFLISLLSSSKYILSSEVLLRCCHCQTHRRWMQFTDSAYKLIQTLWKKLSRIFLVKGNSEGSSCKVFYEKAFAIMWRNERIVSHIWGSRVINDFALLPFLIVGSSHTRPHGQSFVRFYFSYFAKSEILKIELPNFIVISKKT